MTARGIQIKRRCKSCGAYLHQLKVKTWFQDIFRKDNPAYLCMYCDRLEPTPLPEEDHGE